MPNGSVDYLIYLGQRKAIFWANVIQVSVINVDSSPSPFPWNYHHVRQSIRIFDFFDESTCQ